MHTKLGNTFSQNATTHVFKPGMYLKIVLSGKFVCTCVCAHVCVCVHVGNLCVHICVLYVCACACMRVCDPPP